MSVHNNNQTSGFTLLELTVSVLVLTIGLLGLSSALFSSKILNETSRRLIQVSSTMENAVLEAKGAIKDPAVNDLSTIYPEDPVGSEIYCKYYPALGVKGAWPGRESSDVVKVELIVNEADTDPPLDINGNGTLTDTPATASPNNIDVTNKANIATIFIKVTAQWKKDPKNSKEPIKEQTLGVIIKQ